MQPTVEDLFLRYRRGDPRALAGVFDRAAPEVWRVARYLSRSRNEADDLVQATFLAAMQSAARWRPEQPLVPWLLGILANHVRMARRRQRREVPAAAVVPRVPEDPVVAAEHAELRELLRQRIEELPETYRTVLVLQIEHGMTAAEVAHATGRPRATVRSQLHRGLDLLRRALPAGVLAISASAGVGDLAKVRGVVLAAAGEGVVGVSLGVGASALGVLAMKKVLAVLVVVFVAGVFWTWPESKARPSNASAPPDRVTEVAAALPQAIPEQPSVDAAAERILVAAPSVAAAPTTLRVRALWPDGMPAQAMTVTAQALPAEDWFSQRFFVTDLGGIAEWKTAVPGKMRVRARHGGEVMCEVAANQANEVELTIPAGVDARGTVVDPLGNPVGNAIVVIGSRIEEMLEATRTDGSGAFRLRALAPRMYVAAFAEGFSGSLVVRAAEFGEGPVVLKLPALGGAATGRVLDVDGLPLEGAWVAAGDVSIELDMADSKDKMRLRSLSVVRTDASGSFRLLGIPLCKPFPLHAGAAGHCGWKGQVLVDHREPFVEIRLARAVQLRGVVRDVDGKPVARAYVGVTDATSPGKQMGDSRPSWAQARTYTPEDGSFAFTSLAPGTIAVEVHNGKGREQRWVAWREFHGEPGDRLQWDPVVRDDLAIRGSVVDDSGQPLAGWRIEVDAAEGVPLAPTATSGADGGFVVSPCVQALYRVKCYAPGDQWNAEVIERKGVEPGGEPVVVRIGRDRLPSCFVQGTLASDQVGDSQGLMVFDRGRGEQWVKLQAGQPFAWGPLPPGHYALQLQATPSGGQRRATPLVVPLGEHELLPGQRLDLGELRLPTLGELAVELADARGQPVDKTLLRFAMIEAIQGGTSVEIVAGRGSTRVAPGRYLPSTGPNGRQVEHAPIEVRAGERTTVKLRFADVVRRQVRYDMSAIGVPARCYATFRKDGVPLHRVWFNFWRDEPATVDHAFTPGNWELAFELADGHVQSFPFVVTEDNSAPVIHVRPER
ncbi:MAG: sigma-70 family RNA polymerase sigma factor [Planctomycetes bacterium]|nr:sigma-70 family RNA polymerase sigma factor [Planctomycetota bacterium]